MTLAKNMRKYTRKQLKKRDRGKRTKDWILKDKKDKK